MQAVLGWVTRVGPTRTAGEIMIVLNDGKGKLCIVFPEDRVTLAAGDYDEPRIWALCGIRVTMPGGTGNMGLLKHGTYLVTERDPEGSTIEALYGKLQDAEGWA